MGAQVMKPGRSNPGSGALTVEAWFLIIVHPLLSFLETYLWTRMHIRNPLWIEDANDWAFVKKSSLYYNDPDNRWKSLIGSNSVFGLIASSSLWHIVGCCKSHLTAKVRKLLYLAKIALSTSDITTMFTSCYDALWKYITEQRRELLMSSSTWALLVSATAACADLSTWITQLA